MNNNIRDINSSSAAHHNAANTGSNNLNVNSSVKENIAMNTISNIRDIRITGITHFAAALVVFASLLTL